MKKRNAVCRPFLVVMLLATGILAILTLLVTLWFIKPFSSLTTPSVSKPHKIARTSLQCAQALPVNTLVGQVLMIGVRGDDLAAQAEMFKYYHIGGAILMSSPSDPYDGSIMLFKRTGGLVNDPLLIATDEEGGAVQRFTSLGALPAAEQVTQTMSPAQAEKLIEAHGKGLKTVGIDMIFGPVADVAPAEGKSILGDRVFSNNPHVVSAYVQAYVDGWQAAGLLSTLKHFPGMGAASANTDFQPATAPPLNSLQERDFIPYKTITASGVAIMVGNQNVPGWFVGPASLSKEADMYLRGTLGFSNDLVVTDSLDAYAITSTATVAQAVVHAIAAGNDIALIVATDPANITMSLNSSFINQAEAGLKNAITKGTISKEQLAASVSRKLNAQHISACSLTSELNT